MIYESIFTTMLLIIAVVDVRSHVIPNILLIATAAVVLPCVISMDMLAFGLAGMCIGLGLLGTLYFVVPNKVGAGDVKLAGLIGFMIGFPLILLALPLAVIVGSIASFILVRLRGETLGNIAFAPYLCGSGVVSLWFGMWIIGWYLGLF
jgi:leader peptidase (prepilin peptidase)/N-methyltransferase